VEYYHPMNPTEPVRQLLADLVRLPLMFKLLLLYGAGAAVWGWWKARRQAEVISASATWPVYKARVVWAQVSDWQHQGDGESSFVEGVLTYSYTVPGHELEIGEYRKRFEDEDEAGAWAQALRDTFVDVRVDPADVTRSVWQETPISTAPFVRGPELDSSRLMEVAAWGTREVLATTILCTAVVGAFFAAWIQLSCLKGRPLISAEENEAAFFGMHIGAMVCVIGVALIARREKGFRSMWTKSMKAGTTGFAMKVLGLYTTISFFYGWVRTAAQDGESQSLGVLMFSAIWLLFYVSAAIGALSVIQNGAREAHGQA
jgi:hypothetical protein